MQETLDNEIEKIAQNDEKQKDIFITRWEYVSPASAQKLLQSLTTNTFCTHVSLEWVSHLPYDILSKAIISNTVITTLILRDLELGDNGLKAITKALHYNNTIKYLTLSNIGATNHKFFAKIMGFNAVEEFIISFNYISSSSMLLISEALQSNTSITNLNMYCNSIGVKGAASLGVALSRNNSLKILNISCNQIKNCPQPLLTALSTCFLRTFDFSGNLSNNVDVEKLDDSILANPSIKEATYDTVDIKTSERLQACLSYRQTNDKSSNISI